MSCVISLNMWQTTAFQYWLGQDLSWFYEDWKLVQTELRNTHDRLIFRCIRSRMKLIQVINQLFGTLNDFNSFQFNNYLFNSSGCFKNIVGLIIAKQLKLDDYRGTIINLIQHTTTVVVLRRRILGWFSWGPIIKDCILQMHCKCRKCR